MAELENNLIEPPQENQPNTEKDVMEVIDKGAKKSDVEQSMVKSPPAINSSPSLPEDSQSTSKKRSISGDTTDAGESISGDTTEDDRGSVLVVPIKTKKRKKKQESDTNKKKSKSKDMNKTDSQTTSEETKKTPTKRSPNAPKLVSTFYGVCYDNNNWRVQINLPKGQRFRKYFKIEKEAAEQYDTLVREHKLKDRNLNFPTDEEIASGWGKKGNTSSKYHGIYLEKKRSQWQAQIRENGKMKFLGRYPTELGAAKEYDKYIVNNILHHKDKELNFPDDYPDREAPKKTVEKAVVLV